MGTAGTGGKGTWRRGGVEGKATHTSGVLQIVIITRKVDVAEILTLVVVACPKFICDQIHIKTFIGKIKYGYDKPKSLQI